MVAEYVRFRKVLMSWLSNHYFGALGVFLAGLAVGYWLVRWKERGLLDATTREAELRLQDAQRQAESI